MNDNVRAVTDRDLLLDLFVAELARVAYHVALQHGAPGKWLDLQLDLWKTLAHTVEQWAEILPEPSIARLAGPNHEVMP